jgi:putative transposase
MSKRKNHSPEFQARRDVFEYIELFDNPKRKHTNNGMLSSVDLEERQLKLEEVGV